MKSKCSRLGRRKMGKNEKLRNAQSHADPDMEKHLRDAVPAAVAVSSVSREGCRRNRPCKGRPCRLVLCVDTKSCIDWRKEIGHALLL